MPIELVKKKLYGFIKDRNYVNRFTTLENLRLYADKHNISRADMGFALQELKRTGNVAWSKKYGWYAR